MRSSLEILSDTEQQTVDLSPASTEWKAGRRILFRFLFVYYFFYIEPFPLNALPGTDWLLTVHDQFWNALCTWVGIHILRLANVSSLENGSGDRAYDYALHFCILLIALLGAFVWSIFSSRKRNYSKLHEWLRVYVRYSLASTMLVYGSAKVFRTQFPFPHLDRLLEPYGHSSPMGLLWNFRGYSAGYSIFTGVTELTGAILLLFRRTTAAGALLLVAVLSNIVVINFCYDVPVKLESANFLMTSIFLLAPDLRRLIDMLVLNRPSFPSSRPSLFGSQSMKRIAWAVKLFFIGYLLFSTCKDDVDFLHQMNHMESPFAGLYEVDTFIENGQTRPPLTTDTKRWRRVVLSSYKIFSTITVIRMDDSMERFLVQEDSNKKTFTLTLRDDPRKNG